MYTQPVLLLVDYIAKITHLTSLLQQLSPGDILPLSKLRHYFSQLPPKPGWKLCFQVSLAPANPFQSFIKARRVFKWKVHKFIQSPQAEPSATAQRLVTQETDKTCQYKVHFPLIPTEPPWSLHSLSHSHSVVCLVLGSLKFTDILNTLPP